MDQQHQSIVQAPVVRLTGVGPAERCQLLTLPGGQTPQGMIRVLQPAASGVEIDLILRRFFQEELQPGERLHDCSDDGEAHGWFVHISTLTPRDSPPVKIHAARRFDARTLCVQCSRPWLGCLAGRGVDVFIGHDGRDDHDDKGSCNPDQPVRHGSGLHCRGPAAGAGPKSMTYWRPLTGELNGTRGRASGGQRRGVDALVGDGLAVIEALGVDAEQDRRVPTRVQQQYLGPD